jgi:hypothetical protein
MCRRRAGARADRRAERDRGGAAPSGWPCGPTALVVVLSLRHFCAGGRRHRLHTHGEWQPAVDRDARRSGTVNRSSPRRAPIGNSARRQRRCAPTERVCEPRSRRFIRFAVQHRHRPRVLLPNAGQAARLGPTTQRPPGALRARWPLREKCRLEVVAAAAPSLDTAAQIGGPLGDGNDSWERFRGCMGDSNRGGPRRPRSP